MAEQRHILPEVNAQKHDVEFRIAMADMVIEIDRVSDDQWDCTITALVFENADHSAEQEVEPATEWKTFRLTDKQTSATLALVVGEEHLPEDIKAFLYEIAETVWKDVPQHFRPIP